MADNVIIQFRVTGAMGDHENLHKGVDASELRAYGLEETFDAFMQAVQSIDVGAEIEAFAMRAIDSVPADFDPQLGSMQELYWRDVQEAHFDALLKARGLGNCDGGQSGAGTMEIFLIVSDAPTVAKLVIADLTNRELIGWAKVVSRSDGASDFTVHHGGRFSMWEWL